MSAHGFDNSTLYCTNVDFRGILPVENQMTQDGQLLIGSATAPQIRSGFLTSLDSSVTITNGPGTIDLSVEGGGGSLLIEPDTGFDIVFSSFSLSTNVSTAFCGGTVLFNGQSSSFINLQVTDAQSNTLIGQNCGRYDPGNIGYGNVGLGSLILKNIGEFSNSCVAVGNNALENSVADAECVAIGGYSLNAFNAQGVANGTTAIGHNTLGAAISDARNTACGNRVLEVLQGIVDESANDNTAFGYQAGKFLSRGSGNILMGSQSGQAYDSSESFNILIGSGGVQGESSVLRIGDITDSGLLNGINACYIQGIYNNTQDTSGTSQVLTIDNTSGRFGVTTLLMAGDFGTAAFDGSAISLSTAFNSGASVFFENDTNVSILRLTDSNGNTLIGRECGGAYQSDPDLRATSMIGMGFRCFYQVSADATRCVGMGSYVMADAIQPYECVGMGYAALRSWNGGTDYPGVIAIGSRALYSCVADAGGVAIGYRSLTNLNGLSLAEKNTCVGHQTFENLQTGAFNLGLGADAGSGCTSNESSNIYLNSTGAASDQNTLRVGLATGSGSQQLSKAFISGINGNTLGGTPLMVTIDPTTDQLGVQAIPVTGTIPYTDESATFTAASNNGYFVDAACTANLPSSPAQGEIVSICVDTAGAVVVQAAAGQFIRIGSTLSSSGGTATSTAQGCVLEVVYRAATSTWFSYSNEGSFTLA